MLQGRRFHFVIVALLGLWSGSSVQITAAEDVVADLRTKIDRLVQPLVDSECVVGLVVGVRRGDDEFFLPYGRVKLDDDAAPTADTVYEIGSITKAFTGTLLADMSLRGKIDVDRPLQEFLPADVKMPQKDQPITPGLLATHTSGLPRMPNNFDFSEPAAAYANYSPEQAYEFLQDHKLGRAPGEFEYSNFGAGLLGQVLADREGKSYEQLLIDRICQPLGMNETLLELTPELKARLAPPYDADRRPQKNWSFQFFAAAGGIRSTARDMLRFAAAMTRDDDSDVVKALHLAGKQRYELPDKQAIGMGWMIARDGVTRWHNGQTGGYSSYAACVPDKDLAVVVLCNTATLYTTIVGEKIVQTAWGMEVDPPEVRPVVKLADDVLRRYVGRYWLSPFFVLTVKLDDGKLVVRATGQDPFPIYPSAETEFFYRIVDAQITFVVDDEGNVTKLVLHQNGKDMNGLRQPELKTPPAAK